MRLSTSNRLFLVTFKRIENSFVESILFYEHFNMITQYDLN